MANVNEHFEEFCIENRIAHDFQLQEPPQQNEVVELKIQPFQVMTKTILKAHNLASCFDEAVDTTF